MGRNAVGFYWTLPVPWAGFTSLPADIDEAAKASATIRYQRDAIRHHAKEEGCQLIHEEVFLEIEPDRGSDIILGALKKVETLCRAQEAVLMFVDFSDVQGWRSHQPMTDWSRTAGIALERVPADERFIDGQAFDPHAHFAAWRERQRMWSAGKPDREARALARARELRTQGRSYRQAAETLNAEGIPSLTGKPWKMDNIRKLLNDAGD